MSHHCTVLVRSRRKLTSYTYVMAYHTISYHTLGVMSYCIRTDVCRYIYIYRVFIPYLHIMYRTHILYVYAMLHISFMHTLPQHTVLIFLNTLHSYHIRISLFGYRLDIEKTRIMLSCITCTYVSMFMISLPYHFDVYIYIT